MLNHFRLVAVLVATFTFVSTSAFADTPTPSEFCADKDSDKYVDVTEGCVMQTGLKTGDCDDANPAIHPKAAEIRDNGIDEDCVDGDFKTPEWYKRSISNAALKKLLKEIERCEEAKEEGEPVCKYNKVTYKFNLRSDQDDMYVLRDVDCDGVREVIGDDYTETEGDKRKCAKAAAKASAKKKKPAPAVQLPGSTTPTQVPAPAAPVPPRGKASATAHEVQAASAEAKAAAKVAGEAKVDAAEAKAAAKAAVDANAAQDETISKHTTDLEGFGTALKAETKAREEADAVHDEKFGELGRRVDAVESTVGKLLKNGAFAELTLGGGVKVQSASVVYDENEDPVATNRGFMAPSLDVGLNLGVETSWGRANGFGIVSKSWDETTGGSYDSGVMWQVGAESTFLGGKRVGFHALYQEHDAGGDVLGAKAKSRGVGAGLTVVALTKGTSKVGLLVRATAGYEVFGAIGDEPEVSGSPFFGIKLNLLFGAGGAIKKATPVAPSPEPEPEPVEDESEGAPATK